MSDTIPTDEQRDAAILAQRLISLQLGRASLPLFALIVGGVVFGIQRGFTTLPAVLLLGGALASLVAMSFYAIPTVSVRLGNPRKAWMALAALGGAIPYVWSLYVILGLGLWAVVRDSSLPQLLFSAFFFVAGYWFLRMFWRLTELVRNLDARCADCGLPLEVVAVRAESRVMAWPNEHGDRQGVVCMKCRIARQLERGDPRVDHLRPDPPRA